MAKKRLVCIILILLLIFGNVSTVFSVYSNQITEGTLVDVSSGSAINATILNTTGISGTVSLPVGMVAPLGGMAVIINTSNGYSTSMIIPYQQNSAAFAMNVPAGSFILSYSIHQRYGYVGQGFYSSEGTKAYVEQGTQINLTNVSIGDINLNILQGRIISGDVLLPAGYSVNGNTKIDVEAGYKNNMDKWVPVASTVVVLDDNLSNSRYSLAVPENAVGSGYLIRYNIEPGYGILTKGYYINGLVDVSAESKSGIDITLSKEPRALIGDVNNDLEVGIDDLVGMALVYDATAGDANYNIWADFNDDRKIDILDLANLASNYGNRLNVGGNLREVIVGDPVTLIPFMSSDANSADVMSLIFMGLLKRDSQAKIVPDMAESWTVSEENSKVTFNLRRNIKWHDGQPFTASDVKFSYDLIRDLAVNSPRRTNFATVSSINIIDDYTVEFNLSNVDINFLANMANNYIIPYHIWKDADKTKLKELSWSLPIIGNGPFKLVSKNKGNSYIYEANADFYDGKPILDTFAYLVNTSQAAAMNQVINNQAEVVSVPESSINILKGYDNVNVSIVDSSVFEVLVYNFQREMFKDKNIRQAITYAIDKQRIIDECYRGFGSIASGTYLPQLWLYNDSVKKYNFNISEANRLLDEAGWVMGADNIREKAGQKLKFTILTNKGNLMRERAAAYVAYALGEIGMDVSYEYIDWAVFIPDYIDSGNFDAYIGGFSASIDGDNSALYSSDPQIGYQNKGKYSNTRVEELLQLGKSTLDLSLRKLYYDELQQIVADEQPMTFLLFKQMAKATGENVKNVKFVNYTGSKGDILNWYIQP